MPSLPIIKTEKLIRVLRSIGFTVDETKGKGSHAKAYGKSGTFTIIPKNLDAPKTRSSIAKFLISEGVNIEEVFG